MINQRITVARRFVLFSLLAAVCLMTAPAAQAQQKFVNILTGGQSGIYYPLGMALSQIYGKVLPDAKVSVQVTKASAENLNFLQSGKGEIAFALGDTVADAWNGVEDAGFKAPLKKLRAVAGLYSNYIQIVANADAGIKTITDLKGKRISVGAPKSGTELNVREILKAAGMSYSDFAKVEYLGFGESVELMKNHQIDATLQSVGLGAASIKDLVDKGGVVMVAVPSAVVAKMGDAVYKAGVIPANTYNGQTADVPTVMVQNILVTHDGVGDDAVYAMTKAMFDNLDAVVAAHKAAAKISKASAAKGLPIPLHAGAERYYKEAGLLK